MPWRPFRRILDLPGCFLRENIVLPRKWLGAKPLSMHISRHSFAHIAQESGAESSAIKNILGHSNLATTERYMGSFDTSKTDETLRNVFSKKQSSATATKESGATKEEQAIELLKGMTPEQIMAVISAINK